VAMWVLGDGAMWTEAAEKAVQNRAADKEKK
jgi:hypothetical protein